MEHEIEQKEEIALIFTQVFDPEEVATLINYMGMGRSYAYIAYQHLCMIQRALSNGDQLQAEEVADDLMKAVAEFFMAHGIVGSNDGTDIGDEEYVEGGDEAQVIELSISDIALIIMVLILAIALFTRMGQ